MKDTEFTELLNLYLDHEISAADAARLESEVQTNPARRRIYHQYCRMQKACKMVAADFQTDTDAVVAGHDKRVVAFSPDVAAQRRGLGALQTFGTFAAIAACVAIVLVARNRDTANPESLASGTTSAPQIATTAPVTPSAAESARSNPAAVQQSQPRGLVSVPQRANTTLVSNPLLLTGNSQAQAFYAATVRQVDDQLAWLETVQLPPVQQQRTELDKDFLFSAKLGTERALGNRSQPTQQKEQTEESVSFRFVK
jgi:hypothetical protein